MVWFYCRAGSLDPKGNTSVHRPLLCLSFSLKSPGGGPSPSAFTTDESYHNPMMEAGLPAPAPLTPRGAGGLPGSRFKEEGVKSRSFAQFPQVCLIIHPNCGTWRSADTRGTPGLARLLGSHSSASPSGADAGRAATSAETPLVKRSKELSPQPAPKLLGPSAL